MNSIDELYIKELHNKHTMTEIVKMRGEGLETVRKRW